MNYKTDMTVVRKNLISWKIRAGANVNNHGNQTEANHRKKTHDL